MHLDHKTLFLKLFELGIRMVNLSSNYQALIISLNLHIN